MASIASSFARRSGAKPPSSPTPVASPRSCSTRLQRVEDLGAHPQRLGERRAPTGTTMNSCRSSELSACAPPLMTFIIGTGRTSRAVAAEVAVERRRPRRRRPLRDGERDAEDRVRAEPALVRRAVELDQARVDRPLVERVEPATAAAISPFTLRDGLQRRPCRRSALAAVAQLDRLPLAGRRARGHGGAAAARPTRARPRPRPSGCRGSRGSGGRGRSRSQAHPASPWRGRNSGPARRAPARSNSRPSAAASSSAVSTRATKRPSRRAARARDRRPSRRATLTAAKSTSPTSSRAPSVRARRGLGASSSSRAPQLLVEVRERAAASG